jgi:hypothetical protein
MGVRGLAVVVLVGMTVGALAQWSKDFTESAHRRGPHGVEGWTRNYPDPDEPGVRYAMMLVVGRDGKALHRFEQGTYVWKWMFWADGREVAYQSGPKHFMMRCILADVRTGKELENLDCFQELPETAPTWGKALVAMDGHGQ